MTKFIGERVKNDHSNYVIKVSEVKDVTAKRMLRDIRAVTSTLNYLKGIDNRYEILSTHDEPLHAVLKDIKYTLGTSFKLQTLRTEHKHLYQKLLRLGKPKELLMENGFDIEVGSSSLSRQTIRTRLWSLVNNKEDRRIVGLERRSPSTYAVISRLAKKNNISIKEYVENELGFKYGKEG